jgi:DNA-binding transcriptional MerR regulator
MNHHPKTRKAETTEVLIRLPRALKRQYDLLKLQRRGVSLNNIYVAALHTFVSPEDAQKKEAALARRLDRLDRRIAVLERQNEVLAETVALYVRTFLSNTQEIPEEQRSAAGAQGTRRWKKFLDHLSDRLGYGNNLFRDLPERVFTPEDFHALKLEGEEQIAGG